MTNENTQDPQDQTEEISPLQEELAQMTELAKRAMADLQNLKRRQEEERSNLVIFANADLIKKLLPLLDNLDRAKQHVPEGAEEWFKGLSMSIENAHKTLEESGLKAIESLGHPFNPDLHEAITQGPGEKDTVVEEFEKGYTIGSKVIRHAKVKVGNGE
ncbi:nucleotide exchange factor GrpE [Candidatus Peregrinibacteria bacterium CG10_big_fil_rev_8_21_14_0_10_36_19]|nr:MAG: nucleotide exchange factor GrpE [Candidatus Peregrinibacteria bacterium CG10_big_fil_rev_8_21_14_0_10_36_19]